MIPTTRRSLLLCLLSIGGVFLLSGCGGSSGGDSSETPLAVRYGQIDISQNRANMPDAALVFSGEGTTEETYTLARTFTSSTGTTVTLLANSKTGNVLRRFTLRLFLSTVRPQTGATIFAVDSALGMPPTLPYVSGTFITEDDSTTTTIERFWRVTNGSITVEESNNDSVLLRINSIVCSPDTTIENNAATGLFTLSGRVNVPYVTE